MKTTTVEILKHEVWNAPQTWIEAQSACLGPNVTKASVKALNKDWNPQCTTEPEALVEVVI